MKIDEFVTKQSRCPKLLISLQPTGCNAQTINLEDSLGLSVKPRV